MDVVLGQSYFLRFDPKLWAAMQPYPPLGTLYAASYLRERGYAVALFDAMLAESEQEWATALDRHRPRFAVLFEDNFNYLSKMCLLRMRQAAFAMIAEARARGCTVIAAGADMTDHAQLYLEQGADFVLLGEGEATLAELLDALTGRSAQPPAEILGLAWAEGGGRSVVRTARRPDLRDLDALPFPAWDLVDVDRYRRAWRDRHGYFSMNMVTTRGCPYHCNWCAKPIWGQRYNARSAENVVAELRWLRDQFAPDHIWFMDDILGLKPGWIERFAQLSREAGAVTPFKCLQRADLVNAKTAAALSAAGCQTVWIGAESGSQKVLDSMDKGQSVGDIRRAARLLREHGIQVGFFLQFGYPGETWADIALTRRLVGECLPDDIGVSVSYPLPGTKFHERVRLELGAKQNWQDSDDLAMLYHGPYPAAFYRRLHRLVHAEYRLAKLWRRRLWRQWPRALAEAARWLGARLRLELILRQRAEARRPAAEPPATIVHPVPHD
jgi:radical SAM superfamily enzyme YgiQ (UPF0313 family)